MKNSEVNEKWQKAAGNKPRILVCAPSNGAVDNIIKKVMTNGFVDGKGKRYFPSMYRVGSGQSTEIKDQVSLEKAVDDIYKDAADATVMEPRIAALKLKMKATSDLINGLVARLQAIKRACPKTLKKVREKTVDLADNTRCNLILKFPRILTFQRNESQCARRRVGRLGAWTISTPPAVSTG